MFNSKIDLFDQSWVDTVFENRNKAYGAYDLRNKESKITVRATIIGCIIFALLISAPVIMKKIESVTGERETIDQEITLVDLLPPPEAPEDAFVPPPPPVQEVKSLTDIKKFTPPVVAPESEVVEEMATQKTFDKADAGARNVDASADGEVVIDEKPVEHVQEKKVVEDNTTYNQGSVQVQAEPPGGLQKFVEYVVNNLEGMTLENTNELRMQFMFVVDRDGKLTDIQVVSDGGNPEAAQRAVGVLSRAPKWKSAVINGRAVRMSYILPIVVKVMN